MSKSYCKNSSCPLKVQTRKLQTFLKMSSENLNWKLLTKVSDNTAFKLRKALNLFLSLVKTLFDQSFSNEQFIKLFTFTSFKIRHFLPHLNFSEVISPLYYPAAANTVLTTEQIYNNSLHLAQKYARIDICPRTSCFEKRTIIRFIVHSKCFPVSDWLKPHA